MSPSNQTLTLLGGLATIVGLLVGLQQLWSKVINPRRPITKRRRAYALIEDWFKEIDTHLEHGIDFPKLHNMEAKVDQYLKDHNLDKYRLKFTRKFRRRFLRQYGYQRKLLSNKELFTKRTKMRVDQIEFGTYWALLIQAFYKFYENFQNADRNGNYGDVEIRMRLLRMYFKVKNQ